MTHLQHVRLRTVLTVLIGVLAAAGVVAAFPGAAHAASDSQGRVEIRQAPTKVPAEKTSCLSAKPGLTEYLHSAVITSTACNESRTSTTPSPSRVWWHVEAANVAGHQEISLGMPGHENLCLAEVAATHRVQLEVCPIYLGSTVYKSRMWHVHDYADLDGNMAGVIINDATGNCLQSPTYGSTYGHAFATAPCAKPAKPLQNNFYRQLFAKRLVPGLNN